MRLLYTPVLFLAGITPSLATYAGFSSLTHFVPLGDSYTSINFNLANSPPPSTTRPLGFHAPGRPYSNGPNFIAYLTASTSIKTYDLGFGGATIAAGVTPPSYDWVDTFQDQVNLLLSHPANAPWRAANPSKVLFSAWFGINDLRLSLRRNVNKSGYTPPVSALITAYFGVLNKLHSAGARNFLLISVPPLHRAPECADYPANYRTRMAAAVTSYNTALVEEAAKFRSKHPTARVLLYDAYATANSMLDNPEKFGLSSVVKDTFCAKYTVYKPGAEAPQETFHESCEVKVKRYFWLNKAHPTSTVHKVWAQGIRELLEEPRK